MKVGDLVRYLQTGCIHLVVDIEDETFYLDGWADFPFGPLTEIDVINESVELSDEQLENVQGGMSRSQFDNWRCEVINESW
jgi:hypothetical protein